MCSRTFYFEKFSILILSCFCSLDACPSLSVEVDNGFVEYDSIPIKNDASLNETFYLSYTEADFSCNDGYIYTKSAVKICQPNGTWVGPPFIDLCIGDKMR